MEFCPKKDILEMFHIREEEEIVLVGEGNNSCFFLYTKKKLANMMPLRIKLNNIFKMN